MQLEAEGWRYNKVRADASTEVSAESNAYLCGGLGKAEVSAQACAQT